MGARYGGTRTAARVAAAAATAATAAVVAVLQRERAVKTGVSVKFHPQPEYHHVIICAVLGWPLVGQGAHLPDPTIVQLPLPKALTTDPSL